MRIALSFNRNVTDMCFEYNILHFIAQALKISMVLIQASHTDSC